MDSGSVAGPSRLADSGAGRAKTGRPRATTAASQATQPVSPTPTAVGTMSTTSTAQRKVRTVPRTSIASCHPIHESSCLSGQRLPCLTHPHHPARVSQPLTLRASNFPNAAEGDSDHTGARTRNARRPTETRRPATTSRHGGHSHTAVWPNFGHGTSAPALLIG